MKITRIVSVLGALSAIATCTASARAADPAQMEEANLRFQEGTVLMDHGDCEHARVKFLDVIALVKSSTALWNLGYCEVKSGHGVEGVRHLRQYLRSPSAEPKNTKFANDELLPGALAAVGQIAIDAPAGVTVTLDGKDEVGAAPFPDPIAVSPGTHTVIARLGDQVLKHDVEVPAGSVVPVHLLAKAQSPASRAAVSETSAPEHSTRAPESLPPKLTTGRKVAVGLGIAAVVAEAVGIGLGVSAREHDSNAAIERTTVGGCYQSSSPACAQLHDDSSDARSDALTANVLYVSGGVLAAGAIVTWLLAAPKDSRAAFRLEPVVGGGTLGVRIGAPF